MKHPCRTMCWWDNDKKGGHVNGRSPLVWGRGEGLRWVGQPFTWYRTVATRHHRISAIPRIQIAVSQFSFFAKVQQGLCISHIVISLTYHQAHVRTECKGDASPPPFSLHNPPPPPPHVLYICIMRGWARTFLFFPPSFHPSSNSQEVVVFWQQCQWDQNCKGFLLIKKW